MSAAVTSSPQTPALAFFNHSPDTLNKSNAANADQSVARQKRKRTSKEDEEILKAEFRRNPKPDKATRMEIVSKVAMGEKEVQIWFQNRRQNERRRAHPSHGSDGPQDGTCDVPSSDLACSSSSLSSSQGSGSSESQNHTSSSQSDLPPASQISDIENVPSGATANSAPASSSETRTSTATAAAVTQTDTTSLKAPSSQAPSVPCAGYLANRRSASFLRLAEEERSYVFPEAGPAGQPRDASGLRRTHSLVRLSMTADGQARVVTDSDQSPSPPRARQQPDEAAARTRSLRRSYSAVGLEESPGAELRPPRSFKYSNSSIGRSRDSRAWEFWCDSDARNSLTDKAEQEGSGSAADAIGLIRANSRGVLRPLANKTNTPTQSPAASKPGKAGNSKTRPSMSRALTSSGRLQSQPLKQGHQSAPSCQKMKESDSDDIEIPNNDSDKENWEPGVSRTANASHSKVAADDRRKRQRREGPDQKIDAENIAPEDDDEIAQFMGGGSAHARISNGEELGCVEGLLKLSRGGWRYDGDQAIPV